MPGLEDEELKELSMECHAERELNRPSSLRFANASATPTDCKSLSHTLVSAIVPDSGRQDEEGYIPSNSVQSSRTGRTRLINRDQSPRALARYPKATMIKQKMCEGRGQF
jgi:hypothetical protein